MSLYAALGLCVCLFLSSSISMSSLYLFFFFLLCMFGGGGTSRNICLRASISVSHCACCGSLCYMCMSHFAFLVTCVQVSFHLCVSLCFSYMWLSLCLCMCHSVCPFLWIFVSLCPFLFFCFLRPHLKHMEVYLTDTLPPTNVLSVPKKRFTHFTNKTNSQLFPMR